MAEGLELGDQVLGFSSGIVMAVVELSAGIDVGTVAGETFQMITIRVWARATTAFFLAAGLR